MAESAAKPAAERSRNGVKRPRERGDTEEEGGNVVGDVGNDVGHCRGSVDGGGDEGNGRLVAGS